MLSKLLGVNSFELSRLFTETWWDVDEIIDVDEFEGRPRITMGCCLHGSWIRKNRFLVGNVAIELIASTHHQHKV